MKATSQMHKYRLIVAVLLVPYVAFLAFSVLLIGLNFINPVPAGSHWEWVYSEGVVQIVRWVTIVLFVPGSLITLVLAVRNRNRNNNRVTWVIWGFVVATIIWTMLAAQLTSSHMVSDHVTEQSTTQSRALELKIAE